MIPSMRNQHELKKLALESGISPVKTLHIRDITTGKVHDLTVDKPQGELLAELRAAGVVS